MCLNTGYVPTLNSSTFYWLFSTQENLVNSKPLTVWFNSGIGTSSVMSIFMESGPLELSLLGTI